MPRSPDIRQPIAPADIVRSGLCIGCGSCAASDPKASNVLAVHNGRQAAGKPAVPQSDFVVTAGRLWDEGKNVRTLDDAAAFLHVPVEAAGSTSGPNGASAKFENLRLLGELGSARLARVFAARPIYASASVYEPFGLSVLEAASAGCALVLSDIPTFRELWRDSAIFVSPRDAPAFAAACQSLFDDAQQRVRLGRAARNRAQLYTPGRMAQKMAHIYGTLVGAGEPRAEMQLAGAAA